MKPHRTQRLVALILALVVSLGSIGFATADDVARGNALLDEGSIDEAIAVFESALAANPDEAGARIGLARAMIIYNDMEQATQYLEPVLAIDPKNAEANLYNGIALYFKARVAIDDGKVSGYVASIFNDARLALDHAIEGAPDSVEGYQYLGLVTYWQQDFAAAIEAFERGLQIAPGDAFCNFQIGECYQVQAEYEKAIPYYEKAVDLEPAYAEAYRKAGLCHEFLERTGKAEEAYRKAILASPELLDAYKDIWRLYGEDDAKVAKGVAAMKKLLKDLPGQYQAHWYLAHFLARTGKRSEAIRSFDRVLELNPFSTNVYLEIAKLYEQDSRYDRAIEKLKTGLSIAKIQDAEVAVRDSPYFLKMIELAVTLGEKRRFRDAEDLLLYLTRGDPENGFLWNNLGLVYRDWKKYRKSLEAYERAVELQPFDAQVLNDYAVVLDNHFNRSEEAFRWYKKAVEISENVDALENLARFFLRNGQFEEAVQMADRGLKLEPNRMKLRDYKRRAERRLGGV